MRFILVDRIIELQKGREVILLKNISQSEDYFTDHFPGYPIVPGSILLGSFEQGGEILLASSLDFSCRPVLQGFSRASFRQFVVPGDQIEIRLTLDPAFDSPEHVAGPIHVKALAHVQGRKVAEAQLEFSLEKSHGNADVLEACRRLQRLYEVLTSGPVSRAWDLMGEVAKND